MAIKNKVLWEKEIDSTIKVMIESRIKVIRVLITTSAVAVVAIVIIKGNTNILILNTLIFNINEIAL